MNRDRAVEQAEQLLADQICECGHLEADHVFVTPDSPRTRRPCDATCACHQFTAVRFRVERVA